MASTRGYDNERPTPMRGSERYITDSNPEHTVSSDEADTQRVRRTESRRNGGRSENFEYDHEPFRDDSDLHLQGDEVSGPIWFMNPTRAIYSYVAGSSALQPDSAGIERLESKRSDGVGADFDANVFGVEHEWTSRNNRKGRHALIVRETFERANPYATPPTTTGARPLLRGVWRMLTVFTVHDVSYLLAVAFTLACLILVVNAILSFLPYIHPSVQSSPALSEVQAVLGALGSTIFFCGGLIAFSEAVNVNRKGCFGWKLQHIADAGPASTDAEIERKAGTTLLVPDGSCAHHHDSYHVVAGHPHSWAREVSEGRARSSRAPDPTAHTQEPWVWLPSLDELRAHLRYDLGFVAAALLALSSLLYCAMAWTALATTFASGRVALGIRIPQVVAAAGFTASCALSMVETQGDWWRPAPGVLGWHANLCNVVGSVGFLLTAVFGYVQREGAWAEYQFGCSSVWGSLAFLIGSLLQWYEALDKYPVKRVRGKEGP